MFCMLLFNFANLYFYCYVYVYLLLCMLCAVYSVFIVSFCVLFVCKCVLYYCYRASTQSQLTNISYHIISKTMRLNRNQDNKLTDLIICRNWKHFTSTTVMSCMTPPCLVWQVTIHSKKPAASIFRLENGGGRLVTIYVRNNMASLLRCSSSRYPKSKKERAGRLSGKFRPSFHIMAKRSESLPRDFLIK
jgi:hypothetical protein